MGQPADVQQQRVRFVGLIEADDRTELLAPFGQLQQRLPIAAGVVAGEKRAHRFLGFRQQGLRLGQRHAGPHGLFPGSRRAGFHALAVTGVLLIQHDGAAGQFRLLADEPLHGPIGQPKGEDA